jgi:hypothetical protein
LPEGFAVKAEQIYEGSLSNHCLMVIGDDEKIIQDVASLTKGRSGLIYTQEDMAEFYEDELIPEIKKAEKYQNYWIIIKDSGKVKNWTWDRINKLTDANKKFELEDGEFLHLAPTAKIVILAESTSRMSRSLLSRSNIVYMFV